MPRIKNKDIIYIPAEGWLRRSMNPRVNYLANHPYSLILAMADYEDFDQLYSVTSSYFVSASNKGRFDFWHFSQFQCQDKEHYIRGPIPYYKNFLNTQVLTYNTETETYMWRKPFTERYPK